MRKIRIHTVKSVHEFCEDLNAESQQYTIPVFDRHAGMFLFNLDEARKPNVRNKFIFCQLFLNPSWIRITMFFFYSCSLVL